MTETRGPVVKPGDTVEGRYRIIKPLDEGGMGTVFLAEHVLIKRRVAIKFLRPELAMDPDVVERFMNEARAAGTLGHPHIVESTDMGFTRDDVPYIVFEYLEGSLLVDEVYRLGGLTVRRALKITHQIASALQAAHNAGIVHRDLKSENIFLTFKEDAPDHVKVLDFGISRFQEADAETSRSRMVMGTPEFMAPEQVTSPELVDARTDVYALGVIMYEMLAARRPFRNDGQPEKTLHQVVHDEPPPLGRAEAPPGLSEMIVEKLLAKDPARRFQTMREVQQALEAFHTIVRPTGSLTPLSIPVQAAPDEVELSSARVVELPAAPTRRSGLGWLVAALVAGIAGAALLLVDHAPAPETAVADPAPSPALRADAGQLAQALESAARAARMRADAMAATPMLRAAIETDAATIEDMAKSEHLFTPAKGDVIRVFQGRGKTPHLLLQLPASAPGSSMLAPGATELVGDGHGVTVVVASQITNQAGAPGGTLEITAPVDLSAIQKVVSEHALGASLVGLGAPIVLAATHTPGLDVSMPVVVPADLHAGALSLAATLPRPPPPIVRPATTLRNVRYASWGIGGVLLLVYLGVLLRGRKQR